MYMDNIKLFAKNEKELETLIQMVRIYSQDIGMEFGIEKCAILAMKSGKQHKTEWVELPNQVVIRMLREKLRRTRKLLEIKLYSRNLVKGRNTWAVPLIRYSGPFFKWTREELKQMDQRTKN